MLAHYTPYDLYRLRILPTLKPVWPSGKGMVKRHMLLSIRMIKQQGIREQVNMRGFDATIVRIANERKP
jgi:hypothetical protein